MMNSFVDHWLPDISSSSFCFICHRLSDSEHTFLRTVRIPEEENKKRNDDSDFNSICCIYDRSFTFIANTREENRCQRNNKFDLNINNDIDTTKTKVVDV